MTVWDPGQYERYKSYRDRPALDLMAQVPSSLAPRTIWDLGCGTGEHTAVLARRFPASAVLPYVLCQCAGAFLASLILRFSTMRSSHDCYRTSYLPTAQKPQRFGTQIKPYGLTQASVNWMSCSCETS